MKRLNPSYRGYCYFTHRCKCNNYIKFKLSNKMCKDNDNIDVQCHGCNRIVTVSIKH